MSLSRIRSTIRTSVCLATALAAPISFAAQPARQQATAQLLDHAEFPCSNCFFGPSDYYYCLATDNLVLIGYQRTPVLNFEDQSKNYFTGVRPRWASWSPSGERLPISYDDKHIWVSRPEGKEARSGFGAHVNGFFAWLTRGNSKQVRLTRSSKRDIFLNSDRCRAADKTKAD